MPMELNTLVARVRRLHERIRDGVVEACERQATESLSEIAHDGEGDTIYAIDRVSEAVLVEGFESRIAEEDPLVLIGEGLEPDGTRILPEGVAEAECRWRVIVDPIDGTRGLMFQKRSAWILTGIAPNRGADTNLSDIVAAVQTEIPLVKQHLCDTLWAVKGKGVHAERINRLTGERTSWTPRPSTADTPAHGFSTVCRFFPGGRDRLAAVDDRIHRELLGPVVEDKAQCFEDQYISSGGQLAELILGHDRFVADLRPLLKSAGASSGLCSHPYDLCTELIARECGVEVTDLRGGPLRAPLDLQENVGWIGYANAKVRRRMEPVVRAAIRGEFMTE